MTRLLFEKGFRFITPPWLQRVVGKHLMEAIGAQMDTEATRTTQGVLLRFPDATQLEALGYIESDRAIIRGPFEPATDYAPRAITWLDKHKTRGNGYVMMEQLYHYFKDWFTAAMEVVDYAGNRYKVDTSGNVTRDDILWGGGGNYPTEWSRAWLMINLPDETIPVQLISEEGESVVTEDGEAVLVTIDIHTLNDEERALLCRVASAWAPAHLDQMRLVLLYPGGRLWGYVNTTNPASGAQITTTWGPGETWQTTNPVEVECV